MKNVNGLFVKNLFISIEGKEILHGISLSVKPGEVHAIMGPNGSGKSTLSYALMGHPAYRIAEGGMQKAEITKLKSSILLNGSEISLIPTELRAKAGLFMAMQSPVAVPGVTVLNILREAYTETHRKVGMKIPHNIENPILARRFMVSDVPITEFMSRINGFAKKLNLAESLLTRGIHDGFSGGEKKKVEMLEALILNPKYAIFDEIDTGLDVDALKTVSTGIGILKSQGAGILVITHYQRILKYLKPDVVHILVNGRIVDSGDSGLAKIIEKDGYSKYIKNQ
jgi:Fe-S cluster assembly ATP-binding protein